MGSKGRYGIRGTHPSAVRPTKETTSWTKGQTHAKNLETALHVPHQESSNQNTKTIQNRLHQQQVELQMDKPRTLYRQQLESLFSGMRIKFKGEVYLVGGWGGSTETGMWTRLWITPNRCVPAVKCIALAGIPCARWRRKVKSNAFLVFDPQGNIIGIGQDWYAQRAKEKADNILARWAQRYRIKPNTAIQLEVPYRTIT